MNHNKWILLLVVVAVAAVVYWQFADRLTLESLAEQELQLRQSRQQSPGLFAVAALLVYTVITGLSLPIAVPLTLLYGWLFGFAQGLAIVSFASTAGATIAFLLSRYLFRESLQQRFGDRLASFNDNLRREGAFYLFTLRLIAGVPFFAINVVMGLTPMKAWTFWWVSQLGMLAGTAVFVYAGASVPSLAVLAETGVSGILSTKLIAAFALLGVFPLLAKRVIAWLRPSAGDSGAQSSGENHSLR